MSKTRREKQPKISDPLFGDLQAEPLTWVEDPQQNPSQAPPVTQIQLVYGLLGAVTIVMIATIIWSGQI